MKHRLFILTLMAIITLTPAAVSAQETEGTAIVAHRGFWNCDEGGYSNNSLASLRCAQEAGFWGSEFDVNMTSDGVLLVFHDSKVEGKSIEKHTYEDFKYFRLKNGEPIPTIDQYLEQGKKYPGTVLVYELKPHSNKEVENKFVDLTIAKLKEYDLLDPSKVVFISFSYHMCKTIAEKLPEFTVQFLGGDKKPSTVDADGINGIDYHFSIFKLNKKWIKEAHKLDMTTNAWTVNKEKDMRDMLKMKVDMLTTDNPLQARDIMKEMKIKEIKN